LNMTKKLPSVGINFPNNIGDLRFREVLVTFL